MLRLHRFIPCALALLCATLSSTSGAETSKAPQKILVLHMLATGETHRVLSASLVDSKVALLLSPATNSTLGFLATNANGETLVVGSLEDPSTARSPLSRPGEPVHGHQLIARGPTNYLLRLPYQASMKYLYVGKGDLSPGSKALDQKRVSASPGAITRIDLDEWLPAIAK